MNGSGTKGRRPGEWRRTAGVTGVAAVAVAVAATVAAVRGPVAAQETTGAGHVLRPADVFGLEWAADPQVSPDGRRVVYARSFFDIMTDRARSNLWIVDVASGEQRPLTTGNENDGSPRWSPSGDRLLYVSSRGEEGAELWVRWMDASQQEAKITNIAESPGG
ncbi:MAG TPA: DPP IV N-terminal domain-containing protein, partial [Longimicrobiales bacterium]|nr:DPP IV N-terminal domain-containing protein [Longimicrobiales bacterium]